MVVNVHEACSALYTSARFDFSIRRGANIHESRPISRQLAGMALAFLAFNNTLNVRLWSALSVSFADISMICLHKEQSLLRKCTKKMKTILAVNSVEEYRSLWFAHE